jgi:HD-like signal output (HDOD) protein
MIDLDAVIQSAKDLDPLPQSLVRLAALVTQPDSDLQEIEEVISLDPPLTGQLLKAANAASTGARTEITSVKMAVTRLGTDLILSLALSTCVKTRMTHEIPAYGLSQGQLWGHSVAAALAAEEIQKAARLPAASCPFTTALLHDVGKLVLGRYLTADVLTTLEKAHEKGGMSLVDAEDEILQVNHGKVGGLVVQSWGLPEGIVRGVTFHHHAEKTDDRGCAAVSLANAIANRAHEDGDPGHTPWHEQLGDSTWAREKLEMTLEQCEGIAATIAERYDEISAKYN